MSNGLSPNCATKTVCLSDCSLRREPFHLSMKKWLRSCPFVAGIGAIRPVCNWSCSFSKMKYWTETLIAHSEKYTGKGWICISSIVDAIGLDTLPLLCLFCKPKFEPEEFLHINVLSIAVAHPSLFLLLNYKDNLKIWALDWAMWYIHRKGEPPYWWNQPMPKRKVIGRKDRVDEKIDSFPLNCMWCVFFFLWSRHQLKEIFFQLKRDWWWRGKKYVRDQGINMCLILLPSQIMRKLENIPL